MTRQGNDFSLLDRPEILGVIFYPRRITLEIKNKEQSKRKTEYSQLSMVNEKKQNA